MIRLNIPVSDDLRIFLKSMSSFYGISMPKYINNILLKHQESHEHLSNKLQSLRGQEAETHKGL